MSETITDEQKLKVKNMREAAAKMQKRRHDEWDENYKLYRNKTDKNRITQRQSVSMPLMKETIQTILSKTDEEPDIYFENLSGDMQKEIFFNEYWKYSKEEDAFVIKDTVDKKYAYLFGRSSMKLNIYDGMIHTEVLDTKDVIIDPNADPSDIDNTAMYIGHRNIFRTLSEVINNEVYQEYGNLEKVRDYYKSDEGANDSAQNKKDLEDKQQRLNDIGYGIDIETGQTLLSLTENYYKQFDEDADEFRWHLMVTVDTKKGSITIMDKPMTDILGVSICPIETWAPDAEKTDLYPDGIGDLARTPNKVVNAWFSQLVENRTLKNLGMMMYDNTGDNDFTPQAFSPEPWGWYPVPGNPKEKVQRMDIPDLSGSLDEMNFVMQSLERAAATTAVSKGISDEGSQTLGEVEQLVAQSTQRITSMRKYYRYARERLANKWYKIANNNEDKLDSVEVYKKSHKDNYFSKEISNEDWRDEAGYKATVTTEAESKKKNAREIQKFKMAAQEFPGNKPMQKMAKERFLKFLDLNRDEIDEVMEFEEKRGQPDMPAGPDLSGSKPEGQGNASPKPPAPPQEGMAPADGPPGGGKTVSPEQLQGMMANQG